MISPPWPFQSHQMAVSLDVKCGRGEGEREDVEGAFGRAA